MADSVAAGIAVKGAGGAEGIAGDGADGAGGVCPLPWLRRPNETAGRPGLSFSLLQSCIPRSRGAACKGHHAFAIFDEVL
jgi:hypothetical protein